LKLFCLVAPNVGKYNINDAAGNALERHIPWPNSTHTETFQSQINIYSSFRYKCLAIFRISTSRKQTKRKVKVSLFCCVLIYRLLTKHPAFWFKHMTTDAKDTVPVPSPLKMFQLSLSNPTSYWACSLQPLLNPLPTTTPPPPPRTHTHGVNCSNLNLFFINHASLRMQLAQAAAAQFRPYISLIHSHKCSRTLYSVDAMNHCQQLVMHGNHCNVVFRKKRANKYRKKNMKSCWYSLKMLWYHL